MVLRHINFCWAVHSVSKSRPSSTRTLSTCVWRNPQSGCHPYAQQSADAAMCLFGNTSATCCQQGMPMPGAKCVCCVHSTLLSHCDGSCAMCDVVAGNRPTWRFCGFQNGKSLRVCCYLCTRATPHMTALNRFDDMRAPKQRCCSHLQDVCCRFLRHAPGVANMHLEASMHVDEHSKPLA
jgi:hypothetical protein